MQKKSPSCETVMVTHANGLSDYIPNAAAHNRIGYKAMSSDAKAGCTEVRIVGGFLDRMKQY
jgi:hypothetical protein